MEVCAIDPTHLGLLGDDNWLSIVIFYDLAGQRDVQFIPNYPIPIALERWSQYIRFLQERYIKTYLSLHNNTPTYSGIRLRYVLQGEDCTRNFKSIAWESQRDWDDVTLIPDPYYFAELGYESFLPEGAVIPDWSSRRSTIVWRGSTTGVIQGGHVVGFSMETLEKLPRYRMCRILQQIGPTADVGFVSIVQCPDWEREAIGERLQAEGLNAPYISVHDMVNYKFLIDIDGNANSWNFIQRLRMGCCILKVDSPWIQWFDKRLAPWVHYVPVKADLSDLHERAEWCLAHDRKAAQIAENGRRLGLSFRFEAEMQQAAIDIIRASEPLSERPADKDALQQVSKALERLRPDWLKAITARPAFPAPTWLQTAHGTILGRDKAGCLVQLNRDGDLRRAITLFDEAPQGFEALGDIRIDQVGTQTFLQDGGFFLCAGRRFPWFPSMKRTPNRTVFHLSER